MTISGDCSLQTLRGHYVIVYYDASGQHLLEVNESFALLFRRAEEGDFSPVSLSKVLEEHYGLPGEVAVEEASKAIDLWTQLQLTEH